MDNRLAKITDDYYSAEQPRIEGGPDEDEYDVCDTEDDWRDIRDVTNENQRKES